MIHRPVSGSLALGFLLVIGCGGGGGTDAAPSFDDADDDFISDQDEGRDQDIDTDGDGTPDYLDTDSDNDGILDLHDGLSDTDGDGVPNFRDDDSDNDCRSDTLEAGDTDPASAPIDSDSDAIPNFRDLDSDNDGLSDQREDVNCNGVTDGDETSAEVADSDGDGVSDLIEDAAGTNPNDAADSPLINGDFVFVVPFEQPTQPARDDLDFSTNLKAIDVYLLLDRSGSMSEEITTIRNGFQEVLLNLTCPPLGNGDPMSCIPDIWSGLGTIGYKHAAGEGYTHVLDVNADHARISQLPSTVFNEPSCSGQPSCDEVQTLSLWSACTGLGSEDLAQCAGMIGATYPARGGCAGSPAGTDGIGYPCFRPTSLPIILYATDESISVSFRCPDVDVMQAPADNLVIRAANAIGAKIVGLDASGLTNNRREMEYLADGTGAVDITNQNAPLVLNARDSQVTPAIENGLRALANGVPLDISAVASDDPADAVDAVAEFIDHLETQQLDTAECASGLMDEDTNSDQFPDLYRQVQPGTPLCWSLVPKTNTTIEPTANPQMYRATINVYGNGITNLDSRDVYFLVPPLIDFSVD